MGDAALGFRCFEDMNPGSTVLRDYFSNEYTNISYTIDVWQSSGASQLRDSAPSRAVQVAFPAPAPQAALPVTPASVPKGTMADACAGKTIPECVTDAMSQLQQAQKALQQAQQQFSTSVPPLQAAVSNLTETTNKNTASIDKNSNAVSKLTETTNKNTASIEKNSDAIHSNAKAISRNTATLQSDLSWCDCDTYQLDTNDFSTSDYFVNSCGGDSAFVDFTCPDGYMIVQLQAGINSAHGMETCYDNGDGGVGVQCCRPCYK